MIIKELLLCDVGAKRNSVRQYLVSKNFGLISRNLTKSRSKKLTKSYYY